MKLKYSVIIDDPIDTAANRLGSKFINRYKAANGNEYATISPHPFITIDISKTMDKGEEKSQGSSITLNRYAKMKLEYELRGMLNFAVARNDLFIERMDKSIYLNDRIPHVTEPKIITTSNKRCGLRFSVIHDPDTNEEYEGIIFMISSMDNFCYLTMEEAQYLLYTLQSINMTGLVMELITYYELIKDKNNDSEVDLTQEVKPKLINEEREIEVRETSSLPVERNDNTFASLGIE